MTLMMLRLWVRSLHVRCVGVGGVSTAADCSLDGLNVLIIQFSMQGCCALWVRSLHVRCVGVGGVSTAADCSLEELNVLIIHLSMTPASGRVQLASSVCLVCPWHFHACMHDSSMHVSDSGISASVYSV